jgi:hypothetical protein
MYAPHEGAMAAAYAVARKHVLEEALAPVSKAEWYEIRKRRYWQDCASMDECLAARKSRLMPAQETGWKVVPDSEVGFVAHSVAHPWCNGHGVTKEAAIKMASDNLESLRCSNCGAVDGERVPVPSGGKLSELPAQEADHDSSV